MIKTNAPIKNLYYFVQDEVIYNISTYQDKDKCGICPSLNKTEEECAAIFPYILLTYSTYKTVNGEEVVDKTGLKQYLWLQNYIFDGDKYNDTKFECTSDLHGDSSATFIERHVNEYKNYCINSIENGGYSPESLRNTCPKYFAFNGNAYDDFINGKKVKVTNVSLDASYRFLNANNINALYKTAAEDNAKKSANSVLKINNQEVNTLTLTVKNIPNN